MGKKGFIVLAAFAISACCFAVNAFSQEADVVSSKPEAKAQEAVPQQSGSCNALRMIALYFPNRFLDITDTFTLELGVGHEIAIQPRITNYCKVIGFTGEKYFIGKGFNRQIGGGHTDGWELDVVCSTASYRYLDKTFGTFDDEFVYDGKCMHIPSPSNNVYKSKIEDFWGIGAFVGCLFSVNAQIHPVEIADAVTGLFLIDITNDDFKDSALVTVE